MTKSKLEVKGTVYKSVNNKDTLKIAVNTDRDVATITIINDFDREPDTKVQAVLAKMLGMDKLFTGTTKSEVTREVPLHEVRELLIVLGSDSAFGDYEVSAGIIVDNLEGRRKWGYEEAVLSVDSQVIFLEQEQVEEIEAFLIRSLENIVY